MRTYLADHPAARRFVAHPKPTPQSYGTLTYYPIHAYRLTNSSGKSRHVRFRIVPEAGDAFRTPEEAARSEPNALLDEMRTRVARGPVRFRLRAQVAEPGDVVDDPTVVWPEERRVVDLGEISVTSAVENSDMAERPVGFLPNKAVKGLEPSDDPFFAARAATYGLAFGRRSR